MARDSHFLASFMVFSTLACPDNQRSVRPRGISVSLLLKISHTLDALFAFVLMAADHAKYRRCCSLLKLTGVEYRHVKI